MFYDIIIIGGGAAGLMAAYGAASSMEKPSVMVLEKMPRPGRKIMITGKGRCNFTNLKDWEDFSRHVRTNPNFLKPSFFNLTPQRLTDLLGSCGLESVVERGDRVFPVSHRASDVVDALARLAQSAGAVIRTSGEVKAVIAGDSMPDGFTVRCADGASFGCTKLIIATGGLSYPGTGSTGDGYSWARSLGHSIKPCFPSLTAIVPKGYKLSDERKDELRRMADRYGTGFVSGPATDGAKLADGLKGHIDRAVPLSEIGRTLCGIELKNVGVKLFAGDSLLRDETGDISFTDGGLEGPVGFAISRDCVKAMLGGAKTRVSVDMKPAIDAGRVKERVAGLWQEIQKDPRSRSLSTGAMMRILLGKLMPAELTNGFLKWNPAVLKSSRNGQRADLNALADALKDWRFEIEGYVGYERCVVTAGGVATEEVIPKTMESRLVRGLYLCGEVLDIDSDTGGYNLHTAFATGLLAGQSAAKKLTGT